MLPFELTKDTPYLALSGELWSVFYEYFNRNWPCYKGFLLYNGWYNKIFLSDDITIGRIFELTDCSTTCLLKNQSCTLLALCERQIQFRISMSWRHYTVLKCRPPRGRQPRSKAYQEAWEMRCLSRARQNRRRQHQYTTYGLGGNWLACSKHVTYKLFITALRFKWLNLFEVVCISVLMVCHWMVWH